MSWWDDLWYVSYHALFVFGALGPVARAYVYTSRLGSGVLIHASNISLVFSVDWLLIM
jgi:hypothetical protein